MKFIDWDIIHLGLHSQYLTTRINPCCHYDKFDLIFLVPSTPPDLFLSFRSQYYQLSSYSTPSFLFQTQINSSYEGKQGIDPPSGNTSCPALTLHSLMMPFLHDQNTTQNAFQCFLSQFTNKMVLLVTLVRQCIRATVGK